MVSWVQGCPKPCDARRGDAARLLIFPVTGGFSEMPSWLQISPPSRCPAVCLSVCLCNSHPARGLSHAGHPPTMPMLAVGVGALLSHGAHRCYRPVVGQSCSGPTMPELIPWALVAVINLRTWLCRGDPAAGIGCASPNGRPRVPQGQGAAPGAPHLMPVPQDQVCGGALPQDPRPGSGL